MSSQRAETARWTSLWIAEPTQTRAPGSVQARLVLLAAAAIIPLLLLFAGVAYVDDRAERVRTGQRQLDVARSMAATVEREQRGALASLQALALSPRLQQADMPGFRNLAMRFIATEPPGSALVLVDEQGQNLVDTRARPEDPLPRRSRQVNDALTEPVFRSGLPLISNLLPSAPDGSLTVSADMPVRENGRVTYDLSLVLPASQFADILATQHLPPGTVAAVFDRTGAEVARLPAGGRFIGHTASASLLPRLLADQEAVLPTISLEGTPVLTAFSHTNPSGWSVGIGVPETDVQAPLLRSLRLAGAAGLAGLLSSAVVAYGMGRRVLRPIQALTRFAAAPDHTHPDHAQPSFGLRELDDVAAALRQSLRERQDAIDALETLNDQLEERVRQETATRVRAQEQLAQSQRLEALGQLAGGIAHDFNNVLQAVIGGLGLIQRRAADEAAVRRLSAMAAEAAARGAAITGRLLTFARRGALVAAAIEPLPLLEGLRDMLTHTLGAGITVQVTAADNLPSLLADRAQLETVLVNLAINARDAMPAGGPLLLSATAETVTGSAANPARLAPGRYIRLAVSDAGSGMPPDILARASEPFFTTKEPGKGTGLGLAMARGFATQSRGGFAINSTPGTGTDVNLWFPQPDTTAAASPPDPARIVTVGPPCASSWWMMTASSAKSWPMTWKAAASWSPPPPTVPPPWPCWTAANPQTC